MEMMEQLSGATVGSEYTSFDGSDYISVSDLNNSLDASGELTISLWLYHAENY